MGDLDVQLHSQKQTQSSCFFQGSARLGTKSEAGGGEAWAWGGLGLARLRGHHTLKSAAASAGPRDPEGWA